MSQAKGGECESPARPGEPILLPLVGVHHKRKAWTWIIAQLGLRGSILLEFVGMVGEDGNSSNEEGGDTNGEEKGTAFRQHKSPTELWTCGKIAH